MAVIQYQSSQTLSGSTTSPTITAPVSIAVGDLLFAQISAGTDICTPPSGWTTLSQVGAGGLTQHIFYKIANSADAVAASFVFTFNVSSRFSAAISRFTLNDQTTPVDQANSTGAGSQNPSTAGITPTKANGMLLMMLAHFHTSSRTVSSYAIVTANPTWTERYDISADTGGGSFWGVALATGSRDELSATGTASASFSGAISGETITIINIVPSGITGPATVTTASITPLRLPIILANAASAIATAIAPTATTIANKWSNAVKHATSWLNQSKS